MTVVLSDHSYGKSRVRLLRVTRSENRHDVRDFTLGVHLRGDLGPAFSLGDNSKLLPADTLRNTVYALAGAYSHEQVEEFALQLSEHFLTYNPQILEVTIDAEEQIFSRIATEGLPQRAAFTPASTDLRTTRIVATRDAARIRSGISGLALLKTTGSSFQGFLRDLYTTSKDVADRVLAAHITARWLYRQPEVAFGPTWYGVRRLLMDVFAQHESRSMLHTLHAMGDAVLESFDDITEIHISVPERHALPIDLAPFGLPNNNEVFQLSDEPRSLIEATLTKS